MKGSHPGPADRCPFVLRHSISHVTSFMHLGMLRARQTQAHTNTQIHTQTHTQAQTEIDRHAHKMYIYSMNDIESQVQQPDFLFNC